MVDLQVSGYAFWAQAAFVDRKIVAWLETDDVIVLYQQVHAALHSAIRAVGRHHFVDQSICAPASVRRIVQMRTVGFDYLFQILYLAHEINLAADKRGFSQIR